MDPYHSPIYRHNHLHDPTKFLSRSSTDRTCNCFFLAVHSQLRRFCDRRVEKILLLTKNYLEAYNVSRFAAYSTLLGIVHNCSLLKDETDGNIMLTSKIAHQVFINHSAGALSVDWERNKYGGIRMYEKYGMYVDNNTVEELEKVILMTVTDPHCINGEHAIF